MVIEMGLILVAHSVWMRSNEPKLCQNVNFYTILVTFVYMAILWHVNDGKLCLLNNMDIEKSKMNQTKFQY
jgi:uncharacterized membrane protein HdeD (DUF308 family)